LLTTALAVLHQIDQQVEHLRFDGNSVVTAAELAPIGIKRMAGKEELHVATPPVSHGIIKPVSRTNQGKGKALAALPRNVRASKGERAVVANLINKELLRMIDDIRGTIDYDASGARRPPWCWFPDRAAPAPHGSR
jgi:hypothetical protein